MIDLHCHLGGAVPSSVLWEILCDSGLQTEFRSFENLHQFLTVTSKDFHDLDDFLGRYFHVTELIQSSPHAASTAVYHAVAKAYRRAEIKGMEIRYNPLKRVHGGHHTLGAIIMATVQGMQRVSMHYHVNTGMIFSMGKELSHASNWTIVEAAVAFCSHGNLNGAHGVVGIDMAGPESTGVDTDDEWLEEASRMVEHARAAGLGITWHVGETDASGVDGMEKIMEVIKPDRIGHGIVLRKAEGKQRERLCAMLRERNVCLEICPSVNKVTKSIDSFDEIADLIRMVDQENIPFCLNTDNPYLIHTNLSAEYDLMRKTLGADAGLLDQGPGHAKRASFMSGVREGKPINPIR
tara:strand:- start:151 stop:1203 length:1053 start_codon:yes stop_codon:yes gene_type:complete